MQQIREQKQCKVLYSAIVRDSVIAGLYSICDRFHCDTARNPANPTVRTIIDMFSHPLMTEISKTEISSKTGGLRRQEMLFLCLLEGKHVPTLISNRTKPNY